MRPERPKGLGLLTIPEVCQELRMGKSWVCQRIRKGDIPSVKLGRNTKVKREVLEEYLERRAYRSQEEEDELLEEGEDQP